MAASDLSTKLGGVSLPKSKRPGYRAGGDRRRGAGAAVDVAWSALDAVRQFVLVDLTARRAANCRRAVVVEAEGAGDVAGGRIGIEVTIGNGSLEGHGRGIEENQFIGIGIVRVHEGSCLRQRDDSGRIDRDREGHEAADRRFTFDDAAIQRQYDVLAGQNVLDA